MNKQKIILQLWENKELNDAIEKMHPEELREDLKSELFVVLCEMDEIKLVDMFDRGVIRFYLVRTMLNMMQSNTSQFYKTFRKQFEPQAAVHERDEDLLDKVDKEVNKLHWYCADILRLYALQFNGNAKELSRHTGIPYMSIIRTLKLTKNQLKKKLRK